jgi:hypothetical protein
LWRSIEAGGNGVFESSIINPPLFGPLSLSGTSEFFLDAHGGTCGGPTSRRKRPQSHAGRPAGWVLVEIGPKKCFRGPCHFCLPSPSMVDACASVLTYISVTTPKLDSSDALMGAVEGVGKIYRTVFRLPPPPPVSPKQDSFPMPAAFFPNHCPGLIVFPMPHTAALIFHPPPWHPTLLGTFFRHHTL